MVKKYKHNSKIEDNSCSEDEPEKENKQKVYFIKKSL